MTDLDLRCQAQMPRYLSHFTYGRYALTFQSLWRTFGVTVVMKRNPGRLTRGLGAIVGVYALFTAWGCATVLMLRSGVVPPVLPDAQTMGSFVPVLVTLPSWQMFLWIVAVLLYMTAAWRLISGQKGALWYSAALACDLSFLALLKLAGAVHAEPGKIDLDYVTAGATISLGFVLWLAERGSGVERSRPLNPGQGGAASRSSDVLLRDRR